MLTNPCTNQSSLFDAAALPQSGQQPGVALGLAILAVVSFRIFLSAQIGPEIFDAAVQDLARGDFGQQVAARLLGLDAVSQVLADRLQAVLG